MKLKRKNYNDNRARLGIFAAAWCCLPWKILHVPRSTWSTRRGDSSSGGTSIGSPVRTFTPVHLGSDHHSTTGREWPADPGLSLTRLSTTTSARTGPARRCFRRGVQKSINATRRNVTTTHPPYIPNIPSVLANLQRCVFLGTRNSRMNALAAEPFNRATYGCFWADRLAYHYSGLRRDPRRQAKRQHTSQPTHAAGSAAPCSNGLATLRSEFGPVAHAVQAAEQAVLAAADALLHNPLSNPIRHRTAGAIGTALEQIAESRH